MLTGAASLELGTEVVSVVVVTEDSAETGAAGVVEAGALLSGAVVIMFVEAILLADEYSAGLVL